MKELIVETWPIDRLVPYARNPRKNDEQVPRMKAAIKEFGFRIPIVAKSDGTVVDGHLRLKAAQELGLESVPVALADELTDTQIKAFRLLANQSANWASWDNDLLKLELEELELDGFDIDLIGFDEDILPQDTETEGLTDPDEVPEIEAESVTQDGDIWILGNHRLMCGDSTDAGSVALLMDGEKADMVFTDPPYNVDYASKNDFLNAVDKGNRNQTPIENDSKKTDEEVGEEIWRPAFQNMADFSNDCCSMFCTMPQGGAHMMMMMMMANASWQVKHEIIWLKNNHVLGRADYNYKHEPILYGWKKTHKFYGGGKFSTSVWEFPKPNVSKLHPTMKPVELIENALLDGSKKGDIVIDLFGGSGSTLMACERQGRKCRMMELTTNYCDVIIKRWQDFTGKDAILERTGQTFNEMKK